MTFHEKISRTFKCDGLTHRAQTTRDKNALAPFNEDLNINVTFRVLRPPNGHFFQQTRTILELIKDIIQTNILTNFHEDLINMISRVLTRKNAPPPSGHVFQPSETIFNLVQDIIGTNLLTSGHTINVASREKCPTPGDHVFQPSGTIFNLVQDIIGTNLLTKFLASRVLTRQIMTLHYE
ncbi:hypothetical protein DPMN_000937 [Dreissena polymorpha]|uniref:Uncharacterized protein n=1 Tax=Dreissena polymorpha TaxID=45954 RepID=A0A9D4RPX7_DREPO|nr:hypothetical protein DPMN_000937 [Dreissena polymorpha]